MNEIIRNAQSSVAQASLDPQDWSEFRTLAHRMLDEAIDRIANIRARPVWQPIPDDVRAAFKADVPREASDLADVYREFAEHVAPYATGNVHPGFMGWVHGGGTAVGMLAEMLAAGLNANLGGRDHMPIEVERQIVAWMRRLFDFPESASGIFVTGTSMANLMAVLVARTSALGTLARQHGVGNDGALLTAYTSQAAHGCVSRAMDIAGLGTDALRKIDVDADHRIDVAALRAQIAIDREVGFKPFLVIASAGTVDIGAIDDLKAIAELCREEGIWFHVDGAFGALAIFSPELAPMLGGIELADSIALDFHKWGQVPYDAGFLLVRDGELHRQAFAQPAAYLRREARGLAAGAVWPCDLGPDLSRGFRALKTWFTLKTFGTDRLGAVIARSCALAKYLETRVLAEPRLELLAPVNLNMVCFRYRADDAVNREIVADVQESGVAAPSSTTLDGRFAIRAAIVNHRTDETDIDALVAAVLEFGARRTGGGLIEVEAPPLAAQ
ncbi:MULTISPECIES: pyridoxal phosphate-dependent decarboxylase family protein [Bradyrhizobium]|jgi:aromatic-L-amino-acid decarboxylase|uniref:pyridoxal phosphate-dependent decarboxylase family protein n=1 Tax=Bradyrhizobium TaxID=374 RepID=UPI000231CDA2|nr:aspartate aminotransferase family protein [Bradyrhizobium japonicum]AJA62146.1 cytochrome D ubiquinol oxidase subunit I [Bradyrhizobium japonicum]KMK00672.1 cytochrome D ubiquinol oxidase subunit I [Bradyrhizobium japonicum]MBR0759389.1 aspartate aminotransferase family protein [Bradyrhizobium japonicum]MCS3541456.1 glutamate/tyrosine decarboxylase-like PLP-dependent enzyme [Bradyrhizobium japonicum]MCS3991360.1 glutamate/tyrosine decarboxylase-like PLP-dependent enzyme [Bradyrhizobium japo